MSHEAKRRFECKECGKTFAQRGHLRTHVDTVHLDLRPYRCDLCDKAFGRKDNLRSHVYAVHTRGRRFCCPHCDARFGYGHHMTRHVRMKHGSGPTVRERVAQRLRSRLTKAVKSQGVEKCAKTMDLVGCTVQELRDHLESKFTDGMSWENHGEWHVDHIKPCASYALADEAQQKECFHYTNLQPLWANDNMSKGSLWEGTRHRQSAGPGNDCA